MHLLSPIDVLPFSAACRCSWYPYDCTTARHAVICEVPVENLACPPGPPPSPTPPPPLQLCVYCSTHGSCPHQQHGSCNCWDGHSRSACATRAAGLASTVLNCSMAAAASANTSPVFFLPAGVPASNISWYCPMYGDSCYYLDNTTLAPASGVSAGCSARSGYPVAWNDADEQVGCWTLENAFTCKREMPFPFVYCTTGPLKEMPGIKHAAFFATFVGAA